MWVGIWKKNYNKYTQKCKKKSGKAEPIGICDLTLEKYPFLTVVYKNSYISFGSISEQGIHMALQRYNYSSACI